MWTFGVGISPLGAFSNTPVRTRAGKTRLARGSTSDTRARRSGANDRCTRRRAATRYRRRQRHRARRRRVARARPRSDSSFSPSATRNSGDARRRGRARDDAPSLGPGEEELERRSRVPPKVGDRTSRGRVGRRAPRVRRRGKEWRRVWLFARIFEHFTERVCVVRRDPAKGREGSRTRNSGFTRRASKNITLVFRGSRIRNVQLTALGRSARFCSALPLG